jgi:hypothetical protein
MSRISLEPDQNGSGVFTIASPNSNTSRTLNLPDAAGTVVTDSATQTLTNKTLTSPTLTTPNINSAQIATVTGTAPIYMCRAWVRFNGQDTPPTINGSGNVSSVTRTATGAFDVSFANAMPDANYSVTATALDSTLSNTGATGHGTGTTTSIAVRHASPSTETNRDPNRMSVAIFR